MGGYGGSWGVGCWNQRLGVGYGVFGIATLEQDKFLGTCNVRVLHWTREAGSNNDVVEIHEYAARHHNSRFTNPDLCVFIADARHTVDLGNDDHHHHQRGLETRLRP